MLDITCKGHEMRDNYARNGPHIHQTKLTQVNTNPGDLYNSSNRDTCNYIKIDAC